MNDLKCKECGAELVPEAKECSVCGCPVEEHVNKIEQIKEKQVGNKINVMAIVSLIIGAVIIIMGIVVMNKEVSMEEHSAGYYNADYAAFGGDFYTEIYGATDIIVDELNDINGGIEVISQSVASAANVIYYPIGMMIIAIGLSVVAISCNHLKKGNI